MNNNDNNDELFSISIEYDEKIGRKKEKEEERKRRNREATIRCRIEKKEKKKKKYNKLYKDVKELARFNNNDEKEIKKELGIKSKRPKCKYYDEADYKRQESLRDYTRAKELVAKVFGEIPPSRNESDDEKEKEYKN